MQEGEVLRVSDLRVAFDVNGAPVEVVKGIGFRVCSGAVTAIVGESGSGKSVTAQAIMRILPKNGRIVSGSIEFRPNGEIADLAKLQPSGPRMRALRARLPSRISGRSMPAAGSVAISARVASTSRRRVDAGTGVITTVAGTGTAGGSGDGGLATAAQVSGPYGIAIDEDGNVHVGEANGDRVRRVEGAGAVPNSAPEAEGAFTLATPVCAAAGSTSVQLDGSASSDPDLDPLVYTWTGPFPEGGDLSGSKAAVLGIYAGLDARVNASRTAARSALRRAGLQHQIVTYPGVDHAFFNPTGARYDARTAATAYRRVLAWLGRHVAG